ncbi:AAA domain-containing protein [Acinetobacter soli]
MVGLNSRQILDRENQIWQMLDDAFEVYGKAAINAKALVKIAFDYDELIDSPNANYETYLSKTRQFVCGTCVGIGHHSIDITNQSFDWVIIDESARSISSELAIAMQSAKRILLVGDHKQLPPLYSPEHAKALGRKLGVSKNRIEANLKSDFERLFNSPYGKTVQGKLLVQYRMAPAIGEMVSACFYDDELNTGVIELLGHSQHKDMVRMVPHIYQQSTVKELRSTVTWVDTSEKFSDGVGTTFFNRHEARKIIDLLERIHADKQLLKELKDISKLNEPPIGIICMYGEQKRHLRRQFNSKSWNEDFKNLVKIDTVDSYQGKENRIIILSITRNSEDNKIGFMKMPNRINVALSRAMDRLVIFGASRLWNMPKHQETPLGEVFSYINERLGDKDHYQYIADPKLEARRHANTGKNSRKGITHD